MGVARNNYQFNPIQVLQHMQLMRPIIRVEQQDVAFMRRLFDHWRNANPEWPPAGAAIQLPCLLVSCTQWLVKAFRGSMADMRFCRHPCTLPRAHILLVHMFMALSVCIR